MSLAARSSPSLACRPYNSTPPENGSTAPILIGSADFAHGAAASEAQQIVQRSERAFIELTFISGIPSPIMGRIAGARSASYATKGSGKMAGARGPAWCQESHPGPEQGTPSLEGSGSARMRIRARRQPIEGDSHEF